MPLYSRTTLVLSFALLATNVSAGDVQQVSCTDGCGVASCTPEGCDSRPGRCRVPRSRKGDYCDPGDGKKRRCTVRSTAQDFALDWAGPCSPAGRLAHRGCPTAQKFVWCCKTKAYPDSGWAPPAHVPIHRTGGGYGNNWHNGAAGGYGPGAPMVYMPTDTTQLGYSYRNVPTWSPNPGMIPPVPNPSNFHNRVCPQQGSAYCPASDHGYMQETMSAGGCTGYAQMSRPVPTHQLASMPKVRPASVKSQPEQLAATKLTIPKMVQVSATQRAVKNETNAPQTVQASATQQEQNVRPATQTVRRSSTQRPGKRTAGTQKKSDGWFGLPSLKDFSL